MRKICLNKNNNSPVIRAVDNSGNEPARQEDQHALSIGFSGMDKDSANELFRDLKHLTFLSIHSYQQDELPEGIGELTNLKELSISNTSLRSLPSSIGNLINLTSLTIDGNEALVSVPSSLSNLINLKKLQIVDNRNPFDDQSDALDLPDGLFSKMVALEKLCLHSNNLERLPAGMECLVSCTILELTSNRLKEVPLMLTELKKLTCLNLYENRLEAIPREITRLENLTILELGSNNIRNIPLEVIVGGWHSVRSYFDSDKTAILPAKTYSHDHLPPDRLEIVKKYEKRIQKFTGTVHQYNHTITNNLESLVKFLKGEIQEMPLLVSEYDISSLESICQIFAPLNKWTFIDHRLLDFLTGALWEQDNYQRGHYEKFYKWVAKQLKKNDFPGLFPAVIQQLTDRGLAEEETIKMTIYHVIFELEDRHTKEVLMGTSLDSYILSLDQDQFHAIAQKSEGHKVWKSYVTDLLLEQDPDKLQPYISALTTINYSLNSDQLNIDVPMLEKVCKHHPARYEPLVLEHLNKTNCSHCKAEIARMLKKYYGHKHHELAKKTCLDTLNKISIARKKNKNYIFNWSEYNGFGDGSSAYVEYVTSTFGTEVKDELLLYARNSP